MGTYDGAGANPYRDAYNNGRLAGMKETVEWFQKHLMNVEELGIEGKWLPLEKWQVLVDVLNVGTVKKPERHLFCLRCSKIEAPRLRCNERKLSQ